MHGKTLRCRWTIKHRIAVLLSAGNCSGRTSQWSRDNCCPDLKLRLLLHRTEAISKNREIFSSKRLVRGYSYIVWKTLEKEQPKGEGGKIQFIALSWFYLNIIKWNSSLEMVHRKLENPKFTKRFQWLTFSEHRT